MDSKIEQNVAIEKLCINSMSQRLIKVVIGNDLRKAVIEGGSRDLHHIPKKIIVRDPLQNRSYAPRDLRAGYFTDKRNVVSGTISQSSSLDNEQRFYSMDKKPTIGDYVWIFSAEKPISLLNFW